MGFTSPGKETATTDNKEAEEKKHIDLNFKNIKRLRVFKNLSERLIEGGQTSSHDRAKILEKLKRKKVKAFHPSNSSIIKRNEILITGLNNPDKLQKIQSFLNQ